MVRTSYHLKIVVAILSSRLTLVDYYRASLERERDYTYTGIVKILIVVYEKNT